MRKKYTIVLTPEERAELEALTRRGRCDARKLTRARALLLADAGDDGPSATDPRISEAVGLTTRAVEGLRKRAVEHGPEVAVHGLPRPPRQDPPKLDGEAEAALLKLACSKPPTGHARWSLRLLSRRLVELEIVESVSHETVRQRLKKTRSSLIFDRCGASPRSKTPSSLRRWSRCSKSTSGLTTRGSRSSAWTSSPSN